MSSSSWFCLKNTLKKLTLSEFFVTFRLWNECVCFTSNRIRPLSSKKKKTVRPPKRSWCVLVRGNWSRSKSRKTYKNKKWKGMSRHTFGVRVSTGEVSGCWSAWSRLVTYFVGLCLRDFLILLVSETMSSLAVNWRLVNLLRFWSVGCPCFTPLNSPRHGHTQRQLFWEISLQKKKTPVSKASGRWIEMVRKLLGRRVSVRQWRGGINDNGTAKCANCANCGASENQSTPQTV